MSLLFVPRDRITKWRNNISTKSQCSYKGLFFFRPKKDHHSGLKKRDTLKKNLYYGIVSRARKFDVKRYCSQKLRDIAWKKNDKYGYFENF